MPRIRSAARSAIAYTADSAPNHAGDRLARATLPDRIETAPEDAPLRLPGGELAIAEHDCEPRQFVTVTVTVTGRALLGPTTANYKERCAVLERPIRELGPEFATRKGRVGWAARYRENLCPVTGRRIDTEVLREGDEPVHDIAL